MYLANHNNVFLVKSWQRNFFTVQMEVKSAVAAVMQVKWDLECIQMLAENALVLPLYR